MNRVTLICADVLTGLSMLPDESVQCVVTSPPYWGLRDYGTPGQIGLEPTIEEFIAKMVAVFREVKRVLRKDGVLWLNLGDSYSSSGGSGSVEYSKRHKQFGKIIEGGTRVPSRLPTDGLKPKDLCGIPWRVALALQADGWYLRSDIIWAKPNPMPESCTDRPTKAHEYIFLLTKSAHYFWDQEAVREAANPETQRSKPVKSGLADGNCFQGDRRQNYEKNRHVVTSRNLRTVWEIATHAFPGSHFATFPPELVRRCVAAGTSERGCCPKCGAPWARTIANTIKGRKTFDGINRGTDDRGIRIRCGESIKETIDWRPSCQCYIRQMKGIDFRKTPEAQPEKFKTEITPCTVLDPFSGAGTTGLVAAKLGRDAIGIELNPAYVEMSRKRIAGELGMLAEIEVLDKLSEAAV